MNKQQLLSLRQSPNRAVSEQAAALLKLLHLVEINELKLQALLKSNEENN
jgi:hypothetical protein